VVLVGLFFEIVGWGGRWFVYYSFLWRFCGLCAWVGLVVGVVGCRGVFGFVGVFRGLGSWGGVFCSFWLGSFVSSLWVLFVCLWFWGGS